MAMASFDFAPLFRSTVGFDRLPSLFDAASRFDETPSYPPYNIEKTGADSYRIVMAVAGFSPEEVSVVAQANSVTITGKSLRDESQAKYLHRGIAARAFERRFDLADHITVNGASLDNGLLAIDLVRQVPEAMKPRTIKIDGAASSAALATKAA
jgi:molecular chaperone IbpA